MKRQKLRASIRAMKQHVSLPCPDAALLEREIQTTQLNQNAVNYQLDGEMARNNTMAFRSFARIHQIISAIFPYVALPPDKHCKLIQMLNELIKTLNQYQVCQPASYV